MEPSSPPALSASSVSTSTSEKWVEVSAHQPETTSPLLDPGFSEAGSSQDCDNYEHESDSGHDEEHENCHQNAYDYQNRHHNQDAYFYDGGVEYRLAGAIAELQGFMSGLYSNFDSKMIFASDCLVKMLDDLRLRIEALSENITQERSEAQNREARLFDYLVAEQTAGRERDEEMMRCLAQQRDESRELQQTLSSFFQERQKTNEEHHKHVNSLFEFMVQLMAAQQKQTAADNRQEEPASNHGEKSAATDGDTSATGIPPPQKHHVRISDNTSSCFSCSQANHTEKRQSRKTPVAPKHHGSQIAPSLVLLWAVVVAVPLLVELHRRL